MISDWSGVAIEYAFAFEKPVLFIDTPQKINNPDCYQIDIVPLEDKNQIRNRRNSSLISVISHSIKN